MVANSGSWAHRRQRRDLRFENGPHFRQMRGSFRLTDLRHQIQRLPHGLRCAVGDEGAAARVRFDQTFFAQRLHRFAHGSAAHAETLGQIALGRELISRLQSAFNNGFFDLLNDLLVKPRRTNSACTQLCPPHSVTHSEPVARLWSGYYTAYPQRAGAFVVWTAARET
jgi:hypothetical protein